MSFSLLLSAAALAVPVISSDVPYEGTLATRTEVDVYAVHVEALRTLAITAETSGGPEYFDGVCVRLLDAVDQQLHVVCPERDGPSATVTATLPRGSYVLQVDGRRGSTVPTGASYAFVVSAPGGLTTAECLAAQDDGVRFAREIERARGRLARAGDRLARRRNRATIRDLRLALERARQRQALDCVP